MSSYLIGEAIKFNWRRKRPRTTGVANKLVTFKLQLVFRLLSRLTIHSNHKPPFDGIAQRIAHPLDKNVARFVLLLPHFSPKSYFRSFKLLIRFRVCYLKWLSQRPFKLKADFGVILMTENHVLYRTQIDDGISIARV